MSYATRRNMIRKANTANTEAHRHLRNAREARIKEAQAYGDVAIDHGKDKSNESANIHIDAALASLEQAKAICDLIVEQGGQHA